MQSPYQHVFGPLPSRRLGYSLGVDVVPHKVCNLNCIYCELGRTTRQTLERCPYIQVGSVMREVEAALKTGAYIDYITFTGSGEPTLNSQLGEMIQRTRCLTDRPIAVLTNGTLFMHEPVRQALMAADVVLPSLNAATEEVFHRVDRPHGRMHIEEVIDGQKLFRKQYPGLIWLEILFVRGINTAVDELRRLRTAIEEIAPDRIQLNTVDRPPAEAEAQAVPLDMLRRIRDFLGGRAEIVAKQTYRSSQAPLADPVDTILALAARRPVTLDDAAASLGRPREEVEADLHRLVAGGKLLARRYAGQIYFAASKPGVWAEKKPAAP